MSRKRALGFILLAAMVVAMARGGSAAGTVWDGSVKYQKPPAYPDHETVQYFVEGCRGDHADAVFNAFIDVRAFQGKTLRFTPAANGPEWILIQDARCEASLTGTWMSTRSTLEWESTGDFLSIVFNRSSRVPESIDGYRYTLEVCPCDP